MRCDFESFNDQLQGRCATSRKLANNTYLKRIDGYSVHDKPETPCIGVLLHATYILRFYEDKCVVDCSGWRSVTTKARLNDWWPDYGRHLHLYSYKGNWCWHQGGEPVHEFLDGDAISRNGNIIFSGVRAYGKRHTIAEIEENAREEKRLHREQLRRTYKEYYEFKDTCHKMNARVRKLSPEKWTPDMIRWLRNSELKRRVINHFGWEKIQKALGAESIQKSGNMELVRMSGFAIPESQFGVKREYRTPVNQLFHDVVILKVVCPSTGSSYCLRVPPHMDDCETARRWTLGDNGHELDLIVET